jgi:hypothetical protein
MTSFCEHSSEPSKSRRIWHDASRMSLSTVTTHSDCLTIVLRRVYSTFAVSSRHNSTGKEHITYPWEYFWLWDVLSFTLDRISKVFSKFRFSTWNVCIEFCSLLGTFAELPKATFGLVTYVYLLVRMEQFVPDRTEYDEDLSIIYRGNSAFIKNWQEYRVLHMKTFVNVCYLFFLRVPSRCV